MSASDARSEAITTLPELDPSTPLTGQLWVFIAFDWGELIDLEKVRKLVPTSFLELPRRSRTPPSIAYNPPPLRFRLGAMPQHLPGLGSDPIGNVLATVFDFAAVSVSFQEPFRLTRAELTTLAGSLSDPTTSRPLVQAAREALMPLYEQLKPAIERPEWLEDLSEEYFVFHFPPGAPLQPEHLLGPLRPWVASLTRLEDQPLAEQELTEALRLTMRYYPHDLVVADWAAAVLLDHELECPETLQTMELANVQLLEYRHIDDRLDKSLQRSQQVLARTVRSALSLLSWPRDAVRQIGELKVDAADLFERTGNVLKLIGDQYLARLYRLLATRFHLKDWERSIQRKLEILEDAYEVLIDHTTTSRGEFMEVIVILLILIEVILAIWRPH
jgi:hypothetical protein